MAGLSQTKRFSRNSNQIDQIRLTRPSHSLWVILIPAVNFCRLVSLPSRTHIAGLSLSLSLFVLPRRNPILKFNDAQIQVMCSSFFGCLTMPNCLILGQMELKLTAARNNPSIQESTNWNTSLALVLGRTCSFNGFSSTTIYHHVRTKPTCFSSWTISAQTRRTCKRIMGETWSYHSIPSGSQETVSVRRARPNLTIAKNYYSSAKTPGTRRALTWTYRKENPTLSTQVCTQWSAGQPLASFLLLTCKDTMKSQDASCRKQIHLEPTCVIVLEDTASKFSVSSCQWQLGGAKKRQK